ncbi:hypothetical protein Acife_3022 [Acidithiobacillus ferrivorans SS3]|uniref:Uncharacterized protein n=1 Tax=Acidithiobacillus ferrivorans SS3 TaxID=743299 RepID=G0JUC6_9PROT|nr:hypothetical protein Acife_3022 [Acidithiobacillus ferrivorans SS3]
MGEMPVVCKKWLTGVILNICRSVQNRVEQAVEALRSILSLVVNHPRPANANDRVAAEAVVQKFVFSAQFAWVRLLDTGKLTGYWTESGL